MELKTYYLEIMDGFDFEKLCENIFSKLNYGMVENTGLGGADEGRDLIIYTNEGKIVVECKHHPNSIIGRPVVMKLHSAVISEGAKKGIVVTSGKFSEEAIVYANKIHPPIELIDKHLLYDLAARAGIEIETSLGKGKVYAFPITNDVSLQQNLSQYLNRILISKPKRIEDITKINKREIRLNPMYLVKYSIDATFSTNVGVIHQEHDQGTFFLNGTDGKILDETISNRFKDTPTNKFSDEDIKNIYVVPFQLLSGIVKESAINHIIKKHTKTVFYIGGNKHRYTKICEPKKKDILLSDILQVYIPENDIDFTLNGKKRFFKIADNGTNNFYVHKENVKVCEICNRSLSKPGILCNDCGLISHNKKLFLSHGFYCKNCGKSICRNCANYYSKFLIFKYVICNDCSKKAVSEGEIIKKFKTIST